MIDARRNLINMESTEDFNAYRYLHTKIDYNTYCREILGTMVPEQEKRASEEKYRHRNDMQGIESKWPLFLLQSIRSVRMERYA